MPREIDEAWIDEAIERYRRIEALREQFDKAVAGHTVTVHSPDDSVEVLVSAKGEILDLRIKGTLHNRSAESLSRQVRTVVTNATEAARWAREKLHDEVFGAYRSLGER